MTIEVTYKHHNPFQYPNEIIEVVVFEYINNVGQAKQKVRNKLCTLQKRKGMNFFRLSSIKDIKAKIILRS